MRAIGATTCRVLGHSWTPLEYARFRIDRESDGSLVVNSEAGPVYLGCARCLLELPPNPPSPPAPIDIVDR